MSGTRSGTWIAGLFLALLAAGCGSREPAPADEHAHADEHGHTDRVEEAGGAASFKPGFGLQLAPATREAIGVETAEVEERKVARSFTVTATVFDAGPPARALTLVPPDIADELEKLQSSEATVLSIRRDVSGALTQVEVVLALPGSPRVGAAREVAFRGAERTIATIPRSAVLRSATGTFVYVVNGAHFLRTEITTGSGDEQFIEVVDGLHPGDVVVTTAVEELWLTELRLTKGGGHSH